MAYSMPQDFEFAPRRGRGGREAAPRQNPNTKAPAARTNAYDEGSTARICALPPGSFGAPPYMAMNSSVSSRACESGTCTGGDFMRYEDGPVRVPPTPLLSASLQQRTASVTIPAEFGESHTSSLSSTFRGTSPNAWPSTRMCAHLRSVSHGT